MTTTVPGPRKPRLLGFIRVLRDAGHAVSVVTTADLSTGGGFDDGLELLERLGVTVERVPFTPSPVHLARAAGFVLARRASTETALYDSPALVERFGELIERTRPDVLHVDRVRALSLIRSSSVPALVDVTDPRVAAYGHYRRSGQLAPWRIGLAETARAWIDRNPARREEARPDGLVSLVASEVGRRALLDCGVEERGVVSVPNVVFGEERSDPVAPAAERRTIGMSGNFAYPPNVLAFDAFVRQTLPLLHRELGVRMALVGARPHPLVTRRAERAGVTLHRDVASVPGTIRAAAIPVMVSPQRISAGFPNRVVDAVYRAGVPIVCSPETVVGVSAGLARGLPVATTPAEWLGAVGSSLREDPVELVERLQQEIELACGPEAVAHALLDAYARAMDGVSTPDLPGGSERASTPAGR